jgi:RNA:NAD 2'-phosphotransferase (TPT1/KptA family)
VKLTILEETLNTLEIHGKERAIIAKQLQKYKVNALKMHEDGFKFYISKNGVWLTKSVPIQYLEQ